MNNIHLFPNSFPPRSTKGSGLFCVRTLGFIAIDRHSDNSAENTVLDVGVNGND